MSTAGKVLLSSIGMPIGVIYTNQGSTISTNVFYLLHFATMTSIEACLFPSLTNCDHMLC